MRRNIALSFTLTVILYCSTIALGQEESYLKLMENHFRMISAEGTDVYGPITTPMWMSVLDTRTGRPPDKPHTPKRVYRLIGAPQGTTLYWDQPLVVAAYRLSQLTGKPKYARSADLYINAFLQHCVDKRGIFQWGNHQYFDATKDTVVQFAGGHHELRPITPAWELFWRQDPKKCERYIRKMLPRHIYDEKTGAFSRHDDGKHGCAFIEAGGILVESAAWLYSKTKDPELLEFALKIARYSYSHRGKATGLIVNQPDKKRWDSEVSTTEIGVWSQSLLRAYRYTSNNEFRNMAQSSVTAYLKYGYNSEAKKYYGQVRVVDGKPVTPEKPGYWPRKYSDVWNTDQWPTHDYPMPLAEACITLYEMTEEKAFLDAIYNWAKVISDATPANGGKGAYAEHYGRCIHFLDRAGRVLNDRSLIEQARTLADEATEALYDNGMFQGFPGTHLYESVDGVGYLFCALMRLETGQVMDLQGFGF